jgi:hypothetical protein
MIRSVLAVIAGLLVGGIVVALCEAPGMFLHPPPPGMDWNDPAQLKAHVAKAPLAAQIGVAVAWTLGPLVGSFVAALLARRAFFAHGFTVGMLFAALDVYYIRTFPLPTWLVVIGVFGPVAMSWLGSSLAEWLAGRPPAGPQPHDLRRKNMAC